MGGDVAAGVVSAGGSEALAPTLSKWMYGIDDPSKLNDNKNNFIDGIKTIYEKISNEQ